MFNENNRVLKQMKIKLNKNKTHFFLFLAILFLSASPITQAAKPLELFGYKIGDDFRVNLKEFHANKFDIEEEDSKWGSKNIPVKKYTIRNLATKAGINYNMIITTYPDSHKVAQAWFDFIFPASEYTPHAVFMWAGKVLGPAKHGPLVLWAHKDFDISKPSITNWYYMCWGDCYYKPSFWPQFNGSLLEIGGASGHISGTLSKNQFPGKSYYKFSLSLREESHP